MKEKIDVFMKELEELSKKHGIWIDPTYDWDVTAVLDGNLKKIGNLELDKTKYIIRDFRENNKNARV